RRGHGQRDESDYRQHACQDFAFHDVPSLGGPLRHAMYRSGVSTPPQTRHGVTVMSCLATKPLVPPDASGKNPLTTPHGVPSGSAAVGNWHFKSLTPSFWPVIGSATSDDEQVPAPPLLTFTGTPFSVRVTSCLTRSGAIHCWLP